MKMHLYKLNLQLTINPFKYETSVVLLLYYLLKKPFLKTQTIQ